MVLFVTLESSLTTISAPQRMCRQRCRVVSLPSASYVICVVMSPMTASARLWDRSSTHDLITATSSHPGRATGLSTATSTICAQRCGLSGFSTSSLRPHHRRSRYSSLAALRIPERVDFKVAVMTFRVLHGLAP